MTATHRLTKGPHTFEARRGQSDLGLWYLSDGSCIALADGWEITELPPPEPPVGAVVIDSQGWAHQRTAFGWFNGWDHRRRCWADLQPCRVVDLPDEAAQ